MKIKFNWTAFTIYKQFYFWLWANWTELGLVYSVFFYYTPKSIKYNPPGSPIYIGPHSEWLARCSHPLRHDHDLLHQKHITKPWRPTTFIHRIPMLSHHFFDERSAERCCFSFRALPKASFRESYHILYAYIYELCMVRWKISYIDIGTKKKWKIVCASPIRCVQSAHEPKDYYAGFLRQHRLEHL